MGIAGKMLSGFFAPACACVPLSHFPILLFLHWASSRPKRLLRLVYLSNVTFTKKTYRER
jgi:hypothetical protein